VTNSVQPGRDRAVLYRFMIMTKLRNGEVAALPVGSAVPPATAHKLMPHSPSASRRDVSLPNGDIRLTACPA